VALIEKLFLKRQPFPQMGVIYLIAASESSVERMLEDWDLATNKGRKMYKEAYVWFSGRASDAIMTKIKSSRILPHIQQLKELNLEYLPLEAQLFSFRDESDLLKLYRQGLEENQRKDYVLLCAEKLASVFATLGDVPLIRYQKDSSLCALMAEATKAKVNVLARYNSQLRKAPNKTICLIVDRSNDPLAPLTHEFTYQAMAYDLLKIGSDMVYTFKSANSDEERQVLLNEQDPVWVRYRHKLIVPDVRDALKEEATEFKNSNADLSSGSFTKDSASTRKLGKIMHRLPDYQRTTQLYSLHLTMINDMMKIFDENRLAHVALQEQNMTVNQDEEGHKLSNILPKLGPLFRENVPDDIKLRLILLYLITQGMTAKNQDRLFKVAKLDEEEDPKRIVDNLAKIGVNTDKKPVFGKLKSLIMGVGKSKKKDFAEMLTLCRFQPKVKEMLDDLLNNKLSTNEYPYFDPPSSAFSFDTKGLGSGNRGPADSLTLDAPDLSVSRSKRKRPSWVDKKKKTANVAEKEELSTNTVPTSEYKVVVFVVGGATWSEARSVYEATQDSGVPCYMGSTSMLTPKSFLEKLEELDI